MANPVGKYNDANFQTLVIYMHNRQSPSKKGPTIGVVWSLTRNYIWQGLISHPLHRAQMWVFPVSNGVD